MFKISIIIPVFNVENYIEAAFESIMNQTIGFENLEVIFVDDASTDNSSRIIDEYSYEYSNVISIHLESNSGDAGRPRNVAMEYATADYIMFLDPDDVFMDNACELLYDEIVKEDADIVSGVHCNGEEVPKFIWLNTLTDPNKKWNDRLKEVNSMVKDSSFSLKVNSIDEYPSIISNSNIWNKIFRKSMIIDNNIKSPEGMPAQDSVFLLETFLNAKSIKFINKIILMHDYNRSDSVGHQLSKQRGLDRLNAYYKMYYLCSSKNKLEIFKHYLLLDKLNYFTRNHLIGCGLSTRDTIELLDYSMPLFELYYRYNNNVMGKFAPLFRYIALKDYENAIRFIHADAIPHQKDIKVAAVLSPFLYNSLVNECKFIDLDSSNWLNQLEIEKPDLFIFEYPHAKYNVDWLNEVLKYCNNNHISTIFIYDESCIGSLIDVSRGFDYMFTCIEEDALFYRDNGEEELHHLDIEDIGLKSETDLINDSGFYNSLVNQYRFRQILDNIDYKYIPYFKHIVLAYKLNDLDELIGIYNHFNSIKYPFKHIKLITDKYSFLTDSISQEDFEKIGMNEKCHCLIVNG